MLVNDARDTRRTVSGSALINASCPVLGGQSVWRHTSSLWFCSRDPAATLTFERGITRDSGSTHMQFRQLRTFLAVVEHLNITRAAEQIHLAQSSVTEQIQALEADLGATLFDRTKRKVRLTEAGKRLRKYAHDLLALADDARASIAEVAAEASGTLMIGGLETLCAARIAPLLASFKQAHPAIDYQLKVANSTALRNDVQNGALDVAFGFGEPPATPDLQGEIIGYEDLVAIAPPAHPLGSRVSVTTDDLAMESFLVTEQGCVYRAMFERTFSAHMPLRPSVVGEFGSLAAIRSLVAHGVGCAIVPRAVVADREYDALCLPWAGDANAVPISIFWHRRRPPAQILDLFLKAARDVLATVKPGDVRRPHAKPSR